MRRAIFLLFLALVWPPFASAQSTIFFVRHAEKADKDAKDPDLSSAGQTRANDLAKILKDVEIVAIFATELKRTQQTAAPIAAALHKEVTIVPAKETATLIEKLKATKGNALVVGHSNTLPGIIHALGISNPITIGENDYDDLFMLNTTSPPTLLHLHYN